MKTLNLNKRSNMDTVTKWLLVISMAVLLGHNHNTYAAEIKTSNVNADMVNKRLPDFANRLPKGNYLWPYKTTDVGFDATAFAAMLAVKIPNSEDKVTAAGGMVQELISGIKQFHWVIDYCVRSDNGALVPSTTDSLKPKATPSTTVGAVENDYQFRCPVPTASAPTTPPTTPYYHIPVSIGITVVMNDGLNVTDVYPTPGLPTGKLYYFAGGWDQKKRFMPVMELPNFVNDNGGSAVEFVSVCREGGVAVDDTRGLADNRYATVVQLKTSVENNNKQLGTQKINCGAGEGLYEFEPAAVAVQVDEDKLKVKFKQFTDVTRYDGQPKSDNDLRLNVFNVGEGNCAILQCPGNLTAVIFDCGTTKFGSYNENFTTADIRAALGRDKKTYHFESQFLNILNGVENIQMVVSHPDGDHYSILSEMLEGSIYFDKPAGGNIDSTNPQFLDGTLGDVLKDKLKNVYLGGEFFKRGAETKKFLRGMADIQKAQTSKFNLYLSMDSSTDDTPKAGNEVLRGKRFVKKGPNFLSGQKAIEYTTFENTNKLHRFGGDSQAEMFPLNVVDPGGAGTCGGATINIVAANTPFDSVRVTDDVSFESKDVYIKSVNHLLKDTRDPEPGSSNKVGKALANNGSSIVTEIVYGSRSILLTADSSFEAVAEALGADPFGITAPSYNKTFDLVSVPHHGSDNGYHYHKDEKDELTNLGSNNAPFAKASRPNNFRKSAGIKVSRLMIQADRVANYGFPHKASVELSKANNLTDSETDRTYDQDNKPMEFDSALEHVIDFKDMNNVEFGKAEVFHTGEYGDLVVDISPSGTAGAKGTFSMNCIGPFGVGANYAGADDEASTKKKWERSRWCHPNP